MLVDKRSPRRHNKLPLHQTRSDQFWIATKLNARYSSFRKEAKFFSDRRRLFIRVYLKSEIALSFRKDDFYVKIVTLFG